MGQPHKHAAVIKAWADGAEIECRAPTRVMWLNCQHPEWFHDVEYRVKPKPHKWQKEMDAAKAGKIIQFRTLAANSQWSTWVRASLYADQPEHWNSKVYEFRIKPEQVVLYGRAWPDDCSDGQGFAAAWKGKSGDNNLKLTFEEGKLVAAEVLRP